MNFPITIPNNSPDQQISNIEVQDFNKFDNYNTPSMSSQPMTVGGNNNLYNLYNFDIIVNLNPILLDQVEVDIITNVPAGDVTIHYSGITSLSNISPSLMGTPNVRLIPLILATSEITDTELNIKSYSLSISFEIPTADDVHDICFVFVLGVGEEEAKKIAKQEAENEKIGVVFHPEKLSRGTVTIVHKTEG